MKSSCFRVCKALRWEFPFISFQRPLSAGRFGWPSWHFPCPWTKAQGFGKQLGKEGLLTLASVRHKQVFFLFWNFPYMYFGPVFWAFSIFIEIKPLRSNRCGLLYFVFLLFWSGHIGKEIKITLLLLDFIANISWNFIRTPFYSLARNFMKSTSGLKFSMFSLRPKGFFYLYSAFFDLPKLMWGVCIFF